jgi:hypothetical protein
MQSVKQTLASRTGRVSASVRTCFGTMVANSNLCGLGFPRHPSRWELLPDRLEKGIQILLLSLNNNNHNNIASAVRLGGTGNGSVLCVPFGWPRSRPV